jgi:hypothetical protein
LPPAAAEYYFKRHVIQRFREAKSLNDVSLKTKFGAKRRKKSFAACGGRILF